MGCPGSAQGRPVSARVEETDEMGCQWPESIDGCSLDGWNGILAAGGAGDEW